MMSSLDRLIAEFCPDGVSFVHLQALANISTGTQLNKELLTEGGDYPVYNGGVNPSGYYHEHNAKSKTIAISQGGASAGWVNWIETPFFAGAHCYVIETKDETSVLERYLFFVLKNIQEKIMKSKQGAGIPGLSRQVLYKLNIPCPPSLVQRKIVEILDNFTELTAEFTARKKAV